MITKVELSSLPAFCVAGISVRTTNQNGQAQSDIGNLWQRWMGENIINQVPGKLSADIYSVYTDYESDHTGAYTAILGCKVLQETQLPEGIKLVSIQAAKYQVRLVEGEMPAAIMQAWQQIWDSPIDRKYGADFEVYPEAGLTEIYLSVK